jgi:hypothetical protein
MTLPLLDSSYVDRYLALLQLEAKEPDSGDFVSGSPSTSPARFLRPIVNTAISLSETNEYSLLQCPEHVPLHTLPLPILRGPHIVPPEPMDWVPRGQRNWSKPIDRCGF